MVEKWEPFLLPGLTMLILALGAQGRPELPWSESPIVLTNAVSGELQLADSAAPVLGVTICQGDLALGVPSGNGTWSARDCECRVLPATGPAGRFSSLAVECWDARNLPVRRDSRS